MLKPKLIDDDKNTISVTLDGRELMSWVYANRDDRAEKMRHAWYFCDGFMAGQGSPRKPWGEPTEAEQGLIPIPDGYAEQ